MIEAYPLHWPTGYPRTALSRRARFDVTFARARDGVLREIALLGGRLPVISTNIGLRRDGLPYAASREPDDPGVAVYFELDGRPKVFACDRWDRVKDNLRAIEKTIEALRGIERWGSSQMVEQAFAGFDALPPPGASNTPHWSTVLGVPRDAKASDVRAAYRDRARSAHPDAPGGSDTAMAALNAARDAALAETEPTGAR